MDVRVDEARQEIWAKIAGELSSEIRLPIGKGLAGTVAATGDPVFNRMWTFYLCYSEAGFRAGYIDVSQLTLARI